MDKLSIYGIRDLAVESGRSVFSLQQLSNLIGKPKSISNVYSSRLVEKGLAIRVLKGKISFDKDEFVISTQMVEPSYVSLNSALLFHGIITQVTKNVECVTSKNSLRYRGLGLVYHKVPSSLFFGYKKYAKSKSYVLVAEPEKAVLDGLYLGMYTQNDFEEYVEKMDLKKFVSFLKKFKGKGSKKISRWVKCLIETK